MAKYRQGLARRYFQFQAMGEKKTAGNEINNRQIKGTGGNYHSDLSSLLKTPGQNARGNCKPGRGFTATA
ncbi:hypothetical protein QQ020_15660 [Fulvivirgaceae bacterium BMA12]|uniref:Uncharacterized protein n=1 Tax=Agaribacillus aureus TaxID=3051825 RepID=A0ABT8L6Y0_9BACT|nr:hypothetical protein [Fulvivirgaceae bacterium BMA12]